jgi:exoribonuclease R
MANETPVTLKLDSSSLFEALRDEITEWRLSEHTYNADTDEVRMSYDSGGSGRIALLTVFELDAEQMARVLSAARPVD